ncbi:MAG: hypothetical protein ACYCPT_07020 [Acidimicrobiales bacterium]
MEMENANIHYEACLLGSTKEGPRKEMLMVNKDEINHVSLNLQVFKDEDYKLRFMLDYFARYINLFPSETTSMLMILKNVMLGEPSDMPFIFNMHYNVHEFLPFITDFIMNDKQLAREYLSSSGNPYDYDYCVEPMDLCIWDTSYPKKYHTNDDFKVMDNIYFEGIDTDKNILQTIENNKKPNKIKNLIVICNNKRLWVEHFHRWLTPKWRTYISSDMHFYPGRAYMRKLR